MRPAVPPIVNQTHSDGLLGKVATPTLPAVDHQALLITLAEEYIDNAHSLSALIARSRQQRDVDEYYQSLSTGLRCLGSAIKVGHVRSFMEDLPLIMTSKSDLRIREPMHAYG